MNSNQQLVGNPFLNNSQPVYSNSMNSNQQLVGNPFLNNSQPVYSNSMNSNQQISRRSPFK